MVLVVISVVTLASFAAGIWVAVEDWHGGMALYSLLREWGIEPNNTVNLLINQFSNLRAQFLTLSLMSIIGLLVVSAVRWQRAHAG